MRRRPEGDPYDYDELLRQSLRREGQQDDVVIHYVKTRDDIEVAFQEIIREYKWIDDPEDPESSIPITVRHIKTRVDDSGNPVGRTSQVGACHFGCVVRVNDLFVCRICRRRACLRHVRFLGGKRAFCIRPICYILGRSYQLLRWIYKIIAYCFKSVTGMQTQSGTSPYSYSDPEESIFGINRPAYTSSREDNLIEEEKR